RPAPRRTRHRPPGPRLPSRTTPSRSSPAGGRTRRRSRTMSDDQHIHIHNSMDANAHIFTVIGTVLAIGGVGMLAWALSNAGMLDLAATGLTMFGFQLVSMMMKVGLIVLPEKSDGCFAETSGNLKTFLREFH